MEQAGHAAHVDEARALRRRERTVGDDGGHHLGNDRAKLRHAEALDERGQVLVLERSQPMEAQRLTGGFEGDDGRKRAGPQP